MQHLSSTNQACLALFVLILMITVNVGETKTRGPKIRTRGCAFYGHSCFGGHGKRSAAAVDSFQRPMPFKFIQEAGHLEVPANYDNSIDDNAYSDESAEQQQQQQQDLKLAVFGLFQRWLNDIRKVRSTDQKRNSAAFELIKVASADPSSVGLPARGGSGGSQ